jgi:hypothetical protein
MIQHILTLPVTRLSAGRYSRPTVTNCEATATFTTTPPATRTLNKVERLRDELATLWSAIEAWQKDVLARLSTKKDDIRELHLLADNVEEFWMETYLKKSLDEGVMLNLKKELLPDMVQHPWE